MIVFLSHRYCCCYKSRDLGQSCQVNAATAASSSLIGSLWPEIQFDGELYMQNHWIINQFNDHMADSTRFCQTCSQIPWSRFLHNDTIFAKLLSEDRARSWQKHCWQKNVILSYFCWKKWLDHPLSHWHWHWKEKDYDLDEYIKLSRQASWEATFSLDRAKHPNIICHNWQVPGL